MKRFDHLLIGFLLGLLVPIAGAFFFYVFLIDGSSIERFVSVMQNKLLLSPLIRLGAVFNLLLFFLFIWSNRELSARGVVASTFIYGGLAAYLAF